LLALPAASELLLLRLWSGMAKNEFSKSIAVHQVPGDVLVYLILYPIQLQLASSPG
jgi:hypothetical protein